MAYRKLYLVCLLCVFECTSLSESFNVGELCAKRCLYGRGGVLCNCNAMHFNGKRSGTSQIPASHLQGYNTMDHHAKFPHNYIRTRLSPDEFDYYSSVNSHDAQPLMKKEYYIDSGVQADSLNGLVNLKLMHNFGQDFDVKRVKEKSRNTKEVTERNGSPLIPVAFLNRKGNENNSDSIDDDSTNVRQEVASTIKQIMSMPITELRDRVGTVNVNDDFVDVTNDPYDVDGDNNEDDDDDDDDSDEESKHNNGNKNNIATAAEEAGWRPNLMHLQKVMRHVRHLR